MPLGSLPLSGEYTKHPWGGDGLGRALHARPLKRRRDGVQRGWEPPEWECSGYRVRGRVGELVVCTKAFVVLVKLLNGN